MSSDLSAVELLQALVRIPSVNPDGAPGTNETGEAGIAEFLRGLLTDWGGDTELREVLPGRPNLLARFPREGAGKPRLLFAPHLDTVSVTGMTIDPFAAELRDGKIWGRGACDTKGSIAAMLTGIFRAREVLPSLSHEIWFSGLMGEEAGQQGSRALGAQEAFDFAIVGEPTGMNVVRQHKGSIWLELTVRGRAAHSSLPHHGTNAVYEMMRFLERMRAGLEEEFGSLEHGLLGHPTFNVGWIHGGSKTNIVPDRCAIGLDLRTVPEQATDDWYERFLERLRNWADGDLEIRNALYALPLDTPADLPMVKRLTELGAEPVGAPWFCDASILSGAGTPSIALGPGSIAQAHTADEWIEVEALEAGAAFFERFLRSLAQS